MLLLLLACHKPTPSPDVVASVAEPAVEEAAQKPALPALGKPPGELPAFPSETRGPAMCADGRGAFEFWIGEYPGPVIDVGPPVTLRGKTHPCALDAIAACTVPTGLYHPWVPETEVMFATVQPILRYQVKAEQTYAGAQLKVGADLKVISYLSEGFCLVQVGEGEIFDAECPAESETLVLLPETRPSNQLIQVSCTEGSKVWIEDTALMSAEGVVQGQMIGYGEVGPAKRDAVK